MQLYYIIEIRHMQSDNRCLCLILTTFKSSKVKSSCSKVSNATAMGNFNVTRG